MRNLGEVFTLVLVNGRRVAQYAIADAGQNSFTNVDAIPSAAIEYTEILKTSSTSYCCTF
jgi:iron complex outermembrane receptor protein